MAALDHRAALKAAIEKLPTELGSWSVPEAVLQASGLQDDPVRAQKAICSCAKWAKDAMHQLPEAPVEELEATDFNDYYKIVMSRVQYIFAQAQAGADFQHSELTYPLCCFQTQLRRVPTFKKNNVEVKLGILQCNRGSLEGSFADVSDEFRQKLAAVGRRPFTQTTLEGLIESRSPRCDPMEDSLAPANAGWTKALTGRCLFDVLPDGQDFTGGENTELKIEVRRDGQVELLVQGPWFRVTFVETPLLQFLAAFMTDYMLTKGDNDFEDWSREALMMFAVTSHRAFEDVITSGKANIMFMSGRRAPSVDFHLLQHMYLSYLWPNFHSSSLLVSRVFHKVGIPLQIAGTWAHEGPMAFMAMYGARLDSNLPVSSLLWTVLFWGCTSNHTVLPDAVGSATYKCMLRDIGLLNDVSIARQDSGRMERFAALFDGICPVMASEIESFSDFEIALACGYKDFGAGGFFGEKRKSLGVEFSLAAKLTKATVLNPDGTTSVGYAGKLGDFPDGSWTSFDNANAGAAKQKFIVSNEVDSDHMFAKLVEFAVKGDTAHDAEVSGKPPHQLMSKSDASALVAELEHILAAPSMAQYKKMANRLSGLMTKIATAVEQLS